MASGGAPAPRNVLLVVDDEAVGEQLHHLLTASADLRCCGIATTLADGIDMLRPGALHAVLVSEVLPDARVWDSVRAFRDLAPAARVVVMTDAPRMELVHEARQAGAAGLVTASTPFDQVLAALRPDFRGRLVVDADVVLQLGGTVQVAPSNGRERSAPQTSLTPRELEVLRLLGRGLDPSGIASELGLSVHTARGHVKRILAKLGAHSQLEAVVMAVQAGLIPQLGQV